MSSSPGSLLFFFLLTFAVSWACFVTVAIAPVTASARAVLLLLGTFAPGLIAVAVTAANSGADGVRALFGRLLPAHVALRWYLFALLYMAAIKGLVAVSYRVGFGAWPRFGDEALWIIVLAIPISTLSQVGEELGWRGWALPRLGRRLGLAWAGLVLGFIWALWHLPLFFVAGADKSGQSFPMYALQVIALSVALTWLYSKTAGSVLLAMLLHAAVNNTKDLVPSATSGATSVFSLTGSATGWLTVAWLWLCAVWFLFDLRKSRGDNGESPRQAS